MKKDCLKYRDSPFCILKLYYDLLQFCECIPNALDCFSELIF
jgi:hypothetical protein